MNSWSEKELLINAFVDHVRGELELSQSTANEHGVAARQFITYLQRQVLGGQWFELLRDERLVSDFINAEHYTESEATRQKKQVALQRFQAYIRQHGRLAWYAAWLKRQERLPIIIVSSALIGGVVLVVTLMPVFERVYGKLFPSATPTITLTQTTTNTASATRTPTKTITPSATSTLTPTLTPTANATQVFLATQSPTADTGFSPITRLHADGSEQAWVPEGSFMAGDHSSTGFDDETVHQVYTDGFWIDRFLVTNGQYAKCPEDVCSPPHSFVSHKRPNGYYGVAEYVDYPVIEITWWQAEAFCEYRGGRLPTEAEWEKAAGWDPRTGQMFIYPWGNQIPDKTLANYDNVDLDTTKVGAYPKGMSPTGAYDLAGNVWEWVLDWYGPYVTNEQINPTGPSAGELKVVRGGSWANTTSPIFLRVSNRGTNRPENANNETGFRCVFSE